MPCRCVTCNEILTTSAAFTEHLAAGHSLVIAQEEEES